MCNNIYFKVKHVLLSNFSVAVILTPQVLKLAINPLNFQIAVRLAPPPPIQTSTSINYRPLTAPKLEGPK